MRLTLHARGPRPVDEVWERYAVPARTWAWNVAWGPVRLSLDHGVRASGGGTRTRLTVHGPAAAVLPYAVPARVSLEMLVRRS